MGIKGPLGPTKGAPTIVPVLQSAAWAEVIKAFRLSPRERQIIECILSGVEGDAFIGERLGMRSATVHTHIGRLYSKLGVSSRSQLLARVFIGYATSANSGGAITSPGRRPRLRNCRPIG